MKYVRNGQIAKREYRGQRSADNFVQFVEEQTADPIKEFTALEELQNMDDKKRYILGYFEQKESSEYQVFRRMATNLKDDCAFYAGFGDVSGFFIYLYCFVYVVKMSSFNLKLNFLKASRTMHPPGQNIVAFRPNKARSNEDDETYTGNYNR